MDIRTIKSLEFDKILTEVALCATSEKAKEDILNINASSNYDECVLLQKQTTEAYIAMNSYNVYPTFDVENITGAVTRAKKLSMLTMGELLKIGRLLKVGKSLHGSTAKLPQVRTPIICGLVSQILLQNMLVNDIERSIFSENEMSDGASPRLSQIRTAIKRANERLKIKLNSYISTPQYQKVLQDNIITKRGDRYVIPVKHEFKGSVQGLVHDQSSSGATLFIEPIAIVEMNNELKILISDEHNEIENILREFTARISIVADEILQNYEIITTLDSIFARAEYAIKTHSTAPILNTRGFIKINSGRHPLISNNRVVPVSVTLGNGFNILLITGPNTGGKTVSLKLVGLLTLMAQSGLYIPAHDESEIAVFDNIFCDIGDEQSIEQSLSTFSSHIKNIVNIMKNYDKNSLILLDELGAGTDPDEGAALAVCLTERLRKSGVKAIITTHYSKLKEYSYSAKGVENACMDFNPDTFEPTYHLIIGVPGTSNALQIAERLGLDKEIIQEAKEKMGEQRENFEEVLQSADLARRKSIKEYELQLKINQEIEKEKTALSEERNNLLMQREKLTATARGEVKRKVQDALVEVNEILAELKNIVTNPTDSSFFEAAKLRKRMETISDLANTTDEDIMPDIVGGVINVGDNVFIKKINKIGTVIKIKRNGDYEIKIGNFITSIKYGGAMKVKR